MSIRIQLNACRYSILYRISDILDDNVFDIVDANLCPQSLYNLLNAIPTLNIIRDEINMLIQNMNVVDYYDNQNF